MNKIFIFILLFSISSILILKSGSFVNAQQDGSVNTRLGLHVGNLNTGSKSDTDLIISTLVEMRVKSVRIVYQSPSSVETTAYAVKQLNDKGIDVLITIMPDMSDYNDRTSAYSDYPNGSDAFESLCGSPGWRWMYKYSTVDQGLYKIRLETLLNEIDRNSGYVTGFEIGNETDFACFNGDIPVVATNDAANPYDLSQTGYLGGTVTGYANTLKTSYQTIKAIQPNASVLTFGSANTYLYGNQKPHINYPNFLLWLTNINGINYLTTYSDATAMHFYPQTITTTSIANTIGPAFTNVAIYRNKFWITEFGFGKSLPQFTGNEDAVETMRLETLHNFLTAVNNLNQVIVERAYLYSFEQNVWSIMESNLIPLKSALIFKQYVSPPIPTVPSNELYGDLNNDGFKNYLDYIILVNDFNKIGAAGWIKSDLIQNGVIDVFDFNKLVSSF